MSSFIERVGDKRELLAQGLFWSGTTRLIRALPQRDLLLVLNYHRIGNREEDPYDPAVFSATPDELSEQVAYIKRYASVVTLEEALAFIDGRPDGRKHCRVLLTFDDGYLDNYKLAFPILRSHGVQGVFFLATSLVGSCDLQWWDRIAYMIRTARKRQFTLRYPAEVAVDLDRDGWRRSLRGVLKLYKRPENTDGARFLRELEGTSNGDSPDCVERCFLDWNEAREMLAGGMAIGSHTHSHRMLTQLSAEQQAAELERSRATLREKLEIAADTLAYPFGGRTSFSGDTEKLAQKAGYRAAFSFHGGTNHPGEPSRYDVKRIGVGDQSWHRFCAQTGICSRTGSFWP